MFNRIASRSLLAGAVILTLAALPVAAAPKAPAAEAAPSAPATGGGEAGGTIAIITVDPSNPYWKAEIDTAKAEVKKLGYQPTTSAHENDPDTQNQLIETAINDKVKGILLDPAGADESVAAVQKARRREHSGGADQRRDQPDRPGQGADRIQQRSGCDRRRRGMGQSHELQGHLRRAPRQAQRQQRTGPI